MNAISKEIVDQIHQMRDAGKSKLAVAKHFNLSYNTVRSWWNKEARVAQSAEAEDLKSSKCGFESHLGYHYSYLLGLYLGDGYINLQNPKYNVYRLRITCDSKYPNLIQDVRATLTAVFNNKTNIVKHKDAVCCDVYTYSQQIPAMFPQHGVGHKHSRHIILENWQKQIITKNPKPFIKGLIQTDGCRYVQTIKLKNGLKQYTKYNFTNTSTDIINIFKWACDLIGLHYTVHSRPTVGPTGEFTGTTRTTITFNKTEDVKLLDTFIGYKC